MGTTVCTDSGSGKLELSCTVAMYIRLLFNIFFLNCLYDTLVAAGVTFDAMH